MARSILLIPSALIAIGVLVAGSGGLGAQANRLVTSATEAPVELMAAALVIGATNQPLSIPPDTPQYIRDYVTDRYDTYIAPTGFCAGGGEGCTKVAVYSPEQLWPFTGLLDLTLDQSVTAGKANLDACIRGAACMITPPPYVDTDTGTLTDTVFVVSGGSQSALIGTYEKSDLIANPLTDKTVRFVLTSNPSRPNGGIASRFPGFEVPFIGMTFPGATPTGSDRANPL